MQEPHDFAVAAHWQGDFDESGLEQWTRNLRSQLRAPQVSLGLVFMTPRYFEHAVTILELLRVNAKIPVLAGCSSQSLIVGATEMEDTSGLTLGLYYLPGAHLKAHHFTQEQIEEAESPSYWHERAGVRRDQINGWLVFADPFHLEGEAWIKSWNAAYAPAPILGGLASGDDSTPRTQIYLNGDVFEEGGVGICFGGDIALCGVISQGCTPIGDTWTITRVDENIIRQIGNRPAYEVIVETFNNLSPQEQKKTRGNLFVGLVVNEYRDEFQRGDFLIRNLIGADPKSGAIAVGAYPRTGQTLQFQRRDAAAASEDMVVLLHQAKRDLTGSRIYGGCLCSCNGRGRGLFGRPNHDAGHVQEQLGPLGLTGFFCNGEIGPVGERNFLHGYTASLALFVSKSKS